MYYVVESKIKNDHVVDQYVENLIKELGLNRLRNPILTVKFVNNLDALGYCDGEKGEYASIQIAKKCHDTGRKLGFIEMMMTLAHEMVHARQFLRGQLSGIGTWKWKGRNADGYEYENQPWEKEAYRLEKDLFVKCFPHHAKFVN